MKKLTFIFMFFTSILLLNCGKKTTTENYSAENFDVKKSIHQFKVKDLYGEIFDFSTLKGKKILVVNTASKCGLTHQYKLLQEVYETYKDQNFIIVGFPANNFDSQEPGTDAEIAQFCKKNFGVTFPMMSKINVIGEKQHEIYQFLTQKDKNRYSNNEVVWNFQKYLLDENGYLVNVVAPTIKPHKDVIIDWITGD